jgi:predicted AAA+ superfamily ATPase
MREFLLVGGVVAEYLERVADVELSDRLRRSGAVLIEGVKGCGKTETARRHSASETLFDLDEAARFTAQTAPLFVLNKKPPQLLDEWQLAPSVWNAVRREVDSRGEPGQFILTGSATPSDDATRHSGAGRFSRIRMRTLSLAESGLSSRQVSLAGILDGVTTDIGGQSALELDEIIEETCHGGWPAHRKFTVEDAMAEVADYLQEIAYADIRMVDGVKRDPDRVLSILRALSKNTSTEATLKTLLEDGSAGVEGMQPDTLREYLTALERLMVSEPLPAWAPVLRSKARLRTSPKHNLVDPALAVSLLNASPDKLRMDLKTFGFLFESLAIRDLRIYASASRGKLLHYRDNTNLEVDAIVDAGYRKWAAFEIKLSASEKVIEKAAAKLHLFANKIDTKASGKPSALGIITAEGYAYTRPDGILVIPLACLSQ